MATAPMNLCNLPPWVIASHHYQIYPRPLEIQGVRHHARGLFKALDQCEDPASRASLFHDYMDVTFQLHQWQRETSQGGRKSLKNSYLRFLRGWMFDSNSLEGAALKGWVESRLGLAPIFHRTPVEDIHSEAYYQYLVDRMKGAARTNAIDAQLDLLFTYVQYELDRLFPEEHYITLYRGINDFTEHRIIERNGCHVLLQLNNLNSFTLDFERAWEFGSRVLKTEVPRYKIFFHSDLFPSSLLKGEGEVIVIGGEYKAKVMIG